MKLQCGCGAKYEFDITPVMSNQPVAFVCPACGLDASEFVDGLVRQELGQATAPRGVPVPIQVSAPGKATTPARVVPALVAPPARPAVVARIHTPAAAEAEAAKATAAEGTPCVKHLGEVATEKCFICSKPICPKCMELFGYVCSPLCKAKADSHGLALPVFEGQRSVVEARLWRKVVWASSVVGVILAALLGVWFWYAWFGSTPRPIFSVRFAEPSYAGQSVITGKENDQIVFLHGDTLARHDLKLKKEIWSVHLLDPKQFAAEAEAEIKSMQKTNVRLRDDGVQDLLRIPSAEKLIEEAQRAAEEELALHVRGQSIWVASPGKLARYDWETGQPVKEYKVPAGFGGPIARGDELMLMESGSSKPGIMRLNLASNECHTEDLINPPTNFLANAEASGGLALGRAARWQATAGLPAGMPGTDMGKPMDPAKVAEQAARMSLPARIALPATLANTMSQERTLAALNDDDRTKSGPGKPNLPAAHVSFFPTKDGFVQFSVRLLESRLVERSAMKAPPARSVLDGNLTAAGSMDAANEILNEMQRSRGGDVVQEDLSRYQVSLQRPGAESIWSGEVIGPPKLYPLETVNVLAADKVILVFDKSNNKLWQSPLQFNIVDSAGPLEQENTKVGLGPCMEHKGSLYVFDAGVLTAFDLAKGIARWRLPSVGIAGIFFDGQDFMYVNTTTASHDSLKYSRQIDISQKVSSQALKIDSKDGKVVWSANVGGLVSYVSGKFIYAVDSYQPSQDELDSPLNDLAPNKGPHLRLRRINPKNGHELWEHDQDRAPLDIGFDKNVIRLVFRKEVQVLKFLTF